MVGLESGLAKVMGLEMESASVLVKESAWELVKESAWELVKESEMEPVFAQYPY